MRERLDKIIEAEHTAWHEDSKGIDDNDMKWLIEQAKENHEKKDEQKLISELENELETVNAAYQDLSKENSTMKSELKRLKKSNDKMNRTLRN